ncbi:MAG: lipopolysaccharide biosynthesis protein [Methylobacteriaceae bacterium]|nr:lipopolysaccharide biosynthesis protein [Methylobacteriaceae bacterium]
MLIRHTFLYLPAQLIGPFVQFVAALVWTHFMAPDLYGVLTFIFAAQDLAFVFSLSWWSQYTLRYFALLPPADRQPYRTAESAVLVSTALIQAAVAIGALVLLRVEPTVPLVLGAVAFTVTRCITQHLSERARSEHRIFDYTVGQTVGPVAGFGLALLAVIGIAPTPECALIGYAGAQAAALIWLLPRLHVARVSWPLPGDIIQTALGFGLPIVIAGAIGWISLNGIRVVVEHAAGATALGLVAVGWGLGQRFTGVAATLVSAASFPLAVRSFASGSRNDAFRQLAQGGVLLIALVLPATAGLCLLTRPFVELTVSRSFQEATMIILPLAAIAGGVRNIRIHFADQVLILMERIDVGIVINVIEAVCVIAGAWTGLHLGGLAGAVEGCLVASVIGAALCFGYIRWKFAFPLPWSSAGRIFLASAIMVAALLLVPWETLHIGSAVRIALEGGLGVIVYAVALGCLEPQFIRIGWRQLVTPVAEER